VFDPMTDHGGTLIQAKGITTDTCSVPGEVVPPEATVSTHRDTPPLFGLGLVDAISDARLLKRADPTDRDHDGISGRASMAGTRVRRFGWKAQVATLAEFSADAYLNEMGITSRLSPDEVTRTCNQAKEPNSAPGPDGLDDVDKFARFIRATQAPGRDTVLAATAAARRGSAMFDRVGCVTCHVRTLTTAPAGTKINGGTFGVPEALGGRSFHPFGDFLLHDVGTGDGIVMAMVEHYGRTMYAYHWKDFSLTAFQRTQNKVRTAPLWGVRLRTRLMHDGATVTLTDAIARHRGEASLATLRFKALSPADRAALLEFLKSL
jgi:CxxC motif-containing protein (DUF1111 family)